jgi:non-canonical (house-cleaning) NTP pyrophosphatase
MIYALLDESAVVRVEHLRAAMALWRYAEDSARYIFGGSTGVPLDDKILAILRDGSATTKQIHEKTHRNLSAKEISGALGRLTNGGLIRSQTVATGGRPAEQWNLT